MIFRFEHNDNNFYVQALLKRNQDLSPTAVEQTAIANLVTKVQAVLDNLVVAPGDFNTCVSIFESIRLNVIFGDSLQ